MFLTRFSLKSPVAITLLFAVVGLLGLVGFARMNRSVLPPVALPVISISAPYPGAAPREIERLVITPIEDELRTLPDLERISSSAQDGVAAIAVRFRFGTSIDADRANVQQAVDSARPNLPDDLLPPAVLDEDPAAAPIVEESITSAILSPTELTNLVENAIAPALRATSGVGRVRAQGEVVRQFTIEPRPGALDEVGAAPLDLFRAVASANDIFPGGRLSSPLQESTVGVHSSANTAQALRQLPVAVPSSSSVRVADVAKVRDDYEDPSVLVNVDGDQAIMLSISRARDAGSLTTIASVSRTFAKLSQRYPLVRFTPLRDDASFTLAATNGVLQTIGEGIALTVLVMLFFLHSWRHALIAAIAIPASLSAALTVMWLIGFTINVLSLMGLSLTIGILVDDSIVILEAIANALKAGLRGDEAAMSGRTELGPAAFAITLVDVAVFAPIAFMSGVVGQFMREFGVTIVVATAFSLLVSFTLTPLLAARWAARFDTRPRIGVLPWMLRTKFARAVEVMGREKLHALWQWEGRLSESYIRWLKRTWVHRRVVAAAAAVACAAALWLVGSGRVATEFSPPINAGHASVSLAFPGGTPLGVTRARTARIAERLLDDPAIRHVVSTTGIAFNGVADVTSANVAQLDAMLQDQTASDTTVVEQIKSMQPLVPEVQIAGAGRSMGGTAPISYDVAGEPNAIDAAAAAIAAALRANPLATDVRTSNAGVGRRIDLAVDPAKTLLLGVSPDDAARTARIATAGATAARVRTTSGLTNVVVRSGAASRGDLDELLRLPVRAGDARRIPLADVTTTTKTVEPQIIERENGEQIVTVTANTLDRVPIGLVTGPLARRLRDPNFLPSGARIEARGDVEQFLDTAGRILATLGLSVVIVYVILAILYRSYALPFAIMLTVPLASVGAFGALFITNEPLNLYSMLGIVMLIGLVAKNGILLVEYAEREVRCGETAYEAMLTAGQRRFRPIVMTTVAMIAGMLPLALGHTAGAQYRQALGIVVIGGLASSLLLTLFIVPIAYIRYRGSPRVATLRSRFAQSVALS